MKARKRPLGLMLLSALLLILALRALGWLLIGGLLGGSMTGAAQGLLGLIIVPLLAGAVGLLRLREWARWLTLAVCSAYFGLTLFNVVVAWPGPESKWLTIVALNGLEAVIALVAAWWYLNRKEVRELFQKPREPRN